MKSWIYIQAIVDYGGDPIRFRHCFIVAADERDAYTAGHKSNDLTGEPRTKNEYANDYVVELESVK